MSALTTLEGLADGTDIAIQQSESRMSRWQVLGGGLIKDGVRLEEWMFGGYLSAGRVYLADFSPPQVGEWFESPGDSQWRYLVAETQPGARVQTIQFRRGAFYQFQERADLLDRFRRCQPPEWATPLVVNLATQLWEKHKRIEQMGDTVRNIYAVQENLRYITTYAERATTTLGRMT